MIWRPWREIRRLRDLSISQRHVADLQTALNKTLTSKIADLESQIRGMLRPAVPEGAVSTGMPEFVMVGVDRSGQGKRIIASKEPTVLAFGMTEMNDPPPRWKIESVMPNALFIDGTGYADAMAKLEVIWRSWEAQQRERDRPAIDAILGIGDGQYHAELPPGTPRPVRGVTGSDRDGTP
jgi:hypothetical protein